MVLLTAIPILAFPITQNNLEAYFQQWNPLFLFLKLYSLTFTLGILFWWKTHPQFKPKFFSKIIYLFLVINILEATVVDFLTENYINGLNGLALIITSPSESTYKLTSYDEGKSQHIEGGFSLIWILFYTVWNFIFVYNQFTTFANHIPLLLAPLLVALFYGKGKWLECRLVTLLVWIGLRLILTVETRPLIIELWWWGNHVISLYGALFASFIGIFSIYFRFRKKL